MVEEVLFSCCSYASVETHLMRRIMQKEKVFACKQAKRESHCTMADNKHLSAVVRAQNKYC